MAHLIRISSRGHRSEPRAAKRLAALLPADWIIFTNIASNFVPTNAKGGTGKEVDLLILGQKLLIIVDLKSQSGKVQAFIARPWLLNGDTFKNKKGLEFEANKHTGFYDSLQKRALEFKDFFAEKRHKVFVDLCIVFSSDNVEIQNPEGSIIAHKLTDFANWAQEQDNHKKRNLPIPFIKFSLSYFTEGDESRWPERFKNSKLDETFEYKNADFFDRKRFDTDFSIKNRDSYNTHEMVADHERKPIRGRKIKPAFVKSFKIGKKLIPRLIGIEGMVIKRIAHDTEAWIDIDEDGSIDIGAERREHVDAAHMRIIHTVKDLEDGTIFRGTITQIFEDHAFVIIQDGRQGVVKKNEINIESQVHSLFKGQQIFARASREDRFGLPLLTMSRIDQKSGKLTDTAEIPDWLRDHTIPDDFIPTWRRKDE